jgi:probable HAF family extracellular repeat protein
MRRLGALLASLLAASASSADLPSFSGVGDLAGGATESVALAISSDGQVVVGESDSTSGSQAFRWTQSGGISGLGFVSMVDPASSARAVSSNGAVIVGSSNDANGVWRAYRWSGGVFTLLNNQSCSSCEPFTEGLGVSGDGLVAVGPSAARGSGSSPLHVDPVRWAGGGVTLSDLGNLTASEDLGQANGASQSGSIIVGNHTSTAGKDAWYWSGSGLNALPHIYNGTPIAASANAISRDGTTIVGFSTKRTITLPGGTVVAADSQAVRWTGANFATATQLGSLPGATFVDSEAQAVSPNGSVIVGRAVDANGSDRAFVWDSTHGMRDLATVLTNDYGLDLGGWVLVEALGVSDVVGGSYTVVGRGVDPQGNSQGWVAYLTPPPCSNGIDDDGDGQTDYPADTGCRSASDRSEQFDCADGLDDDGDGQIDFPADTGCRSATDATERPDCSDAIDDDGDGLTDYPADPGCFTADWPIENPECSNGIDDDGDGNTDHPTDVQCVRPSDLSELPDCSDGIDNDGDGAVDYPADAQCESVADLSENPQCSDGVDNDGNGRIDYPAEYPGCTGLDDAIEAPQCSDGLDNDGDGHIDFPSDAGCFSANGPSESPFFAGQPGLVALDRKSRSVFFVNVATGAQTLISQAAQLSTPQGVALRGTELVVADPAGLFAISPWGTQRQASPALVPKESLQLAFDAAGDPYVLESTQISKVAWSTTGIGVKSAWLTLPALPALVAWEGDALALDASGNLLTTATGFSGNGVFRINAATKAVTILDPGLKSRRWLDLAVEADGTILVAGLQNSTGNGVYRIDPSTGAATALNNTYPWQRPTGIAVGPVGQIWVADAGVCASDGTCSGGKIVTVDRVTGAVAPLASGGFIAGELDLVPMPEPSRVAALTAGALCLLALARWRRSARE